MAESIQEKRARRRKRRKEAREDEGEIEKGVSEKKGYATPSRRKGETGSEQEEDNALVRPFRGVINYFDGVRGELEKVTWPTQEEATRLSYIVAAVTVASSLFLGGLALIFTQLFNVGVDSPSLFVAAFIAFLAVLFAYSRYSTRTRTEL